MGVRALKKQVLAQVPGWLGGQGVGACWGGRGVVEWKLFGPDGGSRRARGRLGGQGRGCLPTR